MKTINHIAGLLGAAAIAVGAWSCTDLDEITFDRIDATTYYQDENSVKGAVASIYSSAAGSFLEYFWYLNEFPADQITWRTWNGGAWGYDEAAKFVLSSQTWNSESVIIRQAWEHAWETIGLCNLLINDLEALDPAEIGMSDASLRSYIAEVRTMRAWAYYNNFELWGGALPLNVSVGNDIPGSADPDFNRGCSIIWQFIADELDGCYMDLAAEDGSSATRNRMNRGMNRMLKMRLLLNSQLFTGVDRYAECATLCQEIIGGTYGVYDLASDYRDIYGINNVTCPEVVFAFAMEAGHATNNNRDTPFLPYNYDEMFDFSCDQSGWNCVCLVPSKDNTGTLVPNAGSEGAKSFLFDYGDKLGAPFDRMNDADIRKQPFTCDAAGNWKGIFAMGAQTNYQTGEPVLADADLQDKPLIYVDQVGTFLNLGRALEPVMSPRWGQTNSGFRVLRYPIYPSSVGFDYRDADQVEFRLAEVYYTLAECRMRAGDAGGAKTLVNDVRQRYFAAADAAALEQPGPGFDSFDMDWMLSEWGLEYLDEGRRRRTDLRRFDKFTQGQWWFFGRATETDRSLPATRDRRYEWYPLPQAALMVNPGLVQNPNY
ncbi:MAG TPA: RagB/SusD family nutrient uptake outer membrane protein [Candidatus Amulumruptor caecigallinarius]|uniref:RagB/SusD family nutrient uptake outer membrane protein n=1 Tax=Candidatus Amulumruptor caecigallinarius TaxID=2109911 RepID=A0A921EAX4_9BACT|nr:RagB/SusD family nutrient uptake outer membrane protein [Candidatus Amulumruptor caecigallinarius]